MASDVQNCDQLSSAVATEAKSDTPSPETRKELIAKALELGCVEHIPDDWGIEVHNG